MSKTAIVNYINGLGSFEDWPYELFDVIQNLLK